MAEGRRTPPGFPPVWDARCRVLILGTYPSPKSRQQQFYYGHPQNRFWPLLAFLLHSPVPGSIEEKKTLLLSNHIALWDTLESCTITGASDASIRDARPNDIGALCQKAPIASVLCNGAAAGRFYQKYNGAAGLPVTVLPSTSPANAAWTMPRLKKAWGQALADAGTGRL